MDPYAVLGVRPGSPEREILAAYREQAKRWHPDRGAGEEAEQRMAEINAAYDLVRAAQQHEAVRARRAALRRPPRAAGRGGWLIPPLRLALGPELLDTLSEGEDVRLVTPTSTWASPRAILAVTERRLLWLLDDAPVARVHSLPFRNIAEITHKVRRKHAALTVKTLVGRRHVFHDLRPHTAAAIEAHVLGPTGAPSYRWRVREVDPVPNVELRRNAHGHEIVVFAFPYRADIVDAVRSIPGRRFDWQAKEWTAPRADATAAYVQGVIERFPELEVADEVETWLARAVKGWVGRITAARRAGAGWFVLDGIAGELPDELRTPAERRGDRRWLPFTQEIAETLLELPGARMDPRALRCASRLQVGLEPAPATLMLVESYGESRFKLEVNWDPDTVKAPSSSCPRPRRTAARSRSTRTCSSRSSTSSACTRSTSATPRPGGARAAAHRARRRDRRRPPLARLRRRRRSPASRGSAASCARSSARA